jgi:solute carrier family 25, member 39/40
MSTHAVGQQLAPSMIRELPVQQQSSSALSARIISGSVGSFITALCVTPLEVVKVHFQNAKPATPYPVSTPHNVSPCPKGCGTFVLNNGLVDCVLPKCKVPYFDNNGNLKCFDHHGAANSGKPITNPQSRLGTFAMIRHIFVNEGFQGIYAGLAPTLVMGVPSTVFYYAAYDEMVSRARNNGDFLHAAKEWDAWIPFFAGSSARLLTTFLTAPLELVRTRQASRVGEGQQVQGMTAEFRVIVQKEGWGALYKGLGPTLWRDVPFSGIYWVCLEQFRALLSSQMPVVEGDSSTALRQAGITFVSGASAGMVAAACTTVCFFSPVFPSGHGWFQRHAHSPHPPARIGPAL